MSFLRPLKVIQKQTGEKTVQTEEKSSRKGGSHKQTICNKQDPLYSPGASPKHLLGTKGHLIFFMCVSRK